MKKVLLVMSALCLLTGLSFAQVTSIATGNWNEGVNWSTGAVPKATDDVVIAAGNTITMDADNGVCKNLTVDGTLTFPDAASRKLTVNGNTTVNATGKFNTFSTGSPASLREHIITLKGDLTVLAGGNFDMRRGSNPNVALGTVVFDGTTTSNITLSQTAYGSSIEEFNSVTINKTGGARVILKAGNLYMSNNSSTGPTILTMTSGIVEVQGTSIWGYLATSSTNMKDFSNASYFIGNLGRGMSNSSEALRVFPVGDSKGYRPVTVKSKATTNATGHMVIVNCIPGNANNNSKLATGIDKVSGVRYYQVSYTKGTTGATSLDLDTLGVSYGADDGVKAGNTNLRVALSTDNRANWSGLSQDILPHTTVIASDPTTIIADVLATPVKLNDGASIYLGLARKTGTTENTLIPTTDVERISSVPSEFNITQNYPNPFNPSTE
ncbi:MAG: G8 domain-containing protein, partial [Syntrophothermus sp.]